MSRFPYRPVSASSAGTARLGLLVLVASVLGSGAGASASRTGGPARSHSPAARAIQPFEANHGQIAAAHRFLSKGNGYEIRLDPAESVFLLPAIPSGAPGAPSGPGRPACTAVHLSYLGAEAARMTGVGELRGVVHYLVGADPRGWVSGVPTYEAVRLAGLYAGVDLTVHADFQSLDYTWTVAPGADPGLIRLGVEGADALVTELPGGELLLRATGGELRAVSLDAYQETAETRVDIGAAVAVAAPNQVSFAIAGYDAGSPLVIHLRLEPRVVGGAVAGTEVRVARDDRGASYVASRALFCDDELGEAFVSRQDAGKSTPTYTTYFGGEGDDIPLGIALRPDGGVLLTGWTSSRSFPTRRPLAAHLVGERDAFVLALTPDGSALDYSTYLGGEAEDEGRAIAVDAAGGAWVTGRTTSVGFPATPDAVQPVPGGLADAFLGRLAPDGSELMYASYLGGSGDDEGNAIGIDGAGRVHLAGSTRSPDFPTERPLQGTPSAEAGQASSDAFLARFAADGTRLDDATYLGGASNDSATGLAVDASGATYVAGWTDSPDFPTGRRALQRHPGGPGRDAFLAKLAPEGGLLYATYLGGAGDDEAQGVGVDSRGRAWVVGTTRSAAFPSTGGESGRLRGERDLFAVEFDAAGESLRRSRWVGGAGDETAPAIAVSPDGSASFAGLTRSADLPSGQPVVAAFSGGLVFFSAPGEFGAGTEAAGCPGTITFDNSAGTSLWQTATNWSTDVLPGPADDVCIGAGFGVTLSSGTQSIGTLTVDATSSLTLSGGSLAIAAASQVDGALTLGGGTLSGAGDVTIAGLLTWTAGAMTGSGTTDADGGIAISGSGLKDLTASRLLNTAGTTTWTGTGQIRPGTGAIIQNSGVWDCQSDATMTNSHGGTAMFDNTAAGTFRKSAGAGTTTISIPFTNAGSVDVQTGTVALSGNGSHDGTFTGSAGATLRFGGGVQTLTTTSSVSADAVAFGGGTLSISGLYAATGSTTVSGGATTFLPAATVSGLGSSLAIPAGTLTLDSGEAISVTTLTLAGGTLGGTDEVTSTGLMTWTAGTMTGAGTTDADGGIAISGSGLKDLTASRLLNTAGTTTWTGTGQIRPGTGAIIQNSGVWDCQSDATITNAFGGTATFDNTAAGTFRKSAGAGTTTISIPFTNDGIVSVETGTLAFAGNGTHDGSFTGLPGATLRFSGGVQTLTTSSSVSADAVAFSGGTQSISGLYEATGTTTVSGGATTFLPAATVSGLGSSLAILAGTLTLDSGEAIGVTTLTLAGVTLGGTDEVTSTGLMTWTGGTMTGAGTTNANGGIAISGAASKGLSASRVLNAAGTTTWTGTGGIGVGTGAIIHNSGLWESQSDGTISNTFSGSATFDNMATGTFRKSAGAGTTTVSIPFDNAGSVDVQTGTLALSGNGSHDGTFTGSAGATLRFSGGVQTLTSLSSVSADAVTFGGGTLSISGLYEATGTTTVSGGATTFLPAATVSSLGSSLAISSGTLTLDSGEAIGVTTLTLSGGTLGGTDEVTSTGLMTWSGGTMTGSGTTNADGGIAISGAGTKTLSVSRVLASSGTTTWTGTGGIGVGTGAIVHNSGLWDCQSDATLSNTLGGTAMFDNTATGTFRKSAGAGTTTVSLPFDNDGSVDVQTGTLALSGNGTHDGTFTGSAGATLRFGGGVQSLTSLSSVSADAVAFSGGTLSISGLYEATGTTTVSGGAATFFPASTVSSLGNSLALPGGTLTLDSGEAIGVTTLTLSGGTLGGTDEVASAGLTTWTAGTMTGAGTTITDGGIAMSGAGTKSLSVSRILNATGPTTWTGTGQIHLGTGAIIHNSGLWDGQSDAQIVNGFGGAATFDNMATGTFRKSAGAGTTIVNIPFDNAGAVETQAGTLILSGGGSHAGSFTGTAGTLRFGGGTHDLLASASVTAPVVEVSSGTVNVGGTYAVTTRTTVSFGTLNLNAPVATTATLTQSQGTVGGTGTLTIPGLFTWTGGAMTGAGTTNADGGIAISGTNSKDLTASRVLNAAGATTWTGTGDVRVSTGAIIHNSGLWDCQSDSSIVNPFVGSAAFDNTVTGTFQKSAGAGTTAVSIPFDNAGSVSVQSGTLALSGNGIHVGSFSGSAGATLRFGGGVHSLTSSSSVSADAVVFSGGTLSISGLYGVPGSTTVSGAAATFFPASTVSSLGSSLTLSGGTLTLDSGEAIGVTTLTLSGGTLGGTDEVTSAGLTTWTDGEMTGAGTTNADGGIAMSGVNHKELTASRILNVGGATTWTGTGEVRIGTGAIIHNSGLWDCQSDSSIVNGFGGAATFDNTAAGTFRKSAGAATTTVSIPFDNAGAVEAQAGTLILSGGGSHAGSFTGTAGTLRFGGGTHDLLASASVTAPVVEVSSGTVNVGGTYAVTTGTTVSFGTLNLNAPAASTATLTESQGTVGGTGTLTIPGLFTWTGGAMTGAGTTNADGGIAISGSGSKDLTASRILNAAGTTTWTGSGQIEMGTGAIIHNSGLWDSQGDSSIVNGFGGSATFDNMAAGTFRKSAGAGTTTVSIPLDNAGTAEAQAGTLILSGGGSHAGSFTGTAGTLRFGGGTHDLLASASVAAPLVDVSGGTVNVAGTYVVSTRTTVSGGALNLNVPAASTATLTESSGTVGGTGTLTIPGLFTWTGGAMTGTGTTNADGGIAISGGIFKDLTASRTLNASGTTTWTGTGQVRVGTGAIIHNSGLWDCQSDLSIPNPFGGSATFDNTAAGTFRKSAGAGTTTVSIPFTNAGGVQASSGTIAFTAGFTQTSGATVLNGGSVTSTTTMNIQGGSVSGVGSVGASIDSDGEIIPGLSPGLLAVAGSYDQGASGKFTVEIGGPTPGTEYDRLAVTGAASLAGTLEVAFVNGFVPPDGTAFVILTAGSISGTFGVEDLPPLPGGGTWQVTYGPTSIILTSILDADGDGVTNALDCAPLDSGAFAVPGEVTGAAFAADAQTYSWTSAVPTTGADTVHDVIRGATHQFPVGGGAAEICLAPGSAAASLMDATTPAARQGFYYLVRGRSVCGTGSYGFRTSGAARTSSSCP